eukprot:IDg13018t1
MLLFIILERTQQHCHSILPVLFYSFPLPVLDFKGDVKQQYILRSQAFSLSCLPKMKSNYLPHLDGLRAVAFSFVLLFHFRVGGAKAGYLGVDMFLVLSGFLMTRIILRDIRAQTFNMRAFMLRRFWRLYPTLLVTTAGTLLVSLILFSTKLQKRVGESALAALLFVSNHYFTSTTGYFDVGTELKPLLHTWSLSLEEQFYFVWPLFLIAVCKATGGSRASTRSLIYLAFSFIVAMAFSLMFACRSHGSHSVTFFLLPSRISEFTAGGLLSLFYDDFATIIDRVYMQDVFSILGAGLVTYPVFNSPKSSLPGPYTMPTIFGTMLLMATPTSVIARYGMSSAPMRLIGKLSYAGYLVHWPVWVFMLFSFDSDGDANINKPILFAITFVLALALHRGVENKFRHSRTTKKTILFLFFMATTLACAYASVKTKGFPDRTIPGRSDLLSYATEYNRMKWEPFQAAHFANLDGDHWKLVFLSYDTCVPTTRTTPQRGLSIPALRKLSDVVKLQAHMAMGDTRLLCSEQAPPRTTTRTSASACATCRLLGHAFSGGKCQRTRKIHGRTGALQYFRSECTELRALGHAPSVAGDPPVFGERPFEALRSCNNLRDMRIRRLFALLRGTASTCQKQFHPRGPQERLMNALGGAFANDPSFRGCVLHDQFPSFCTGRGSARTCMLEIPDPRNAVVPKGAIVATDQANMVYWDGLHLSDFGSWQSAPRFGKLLDRLSFPKKKWNGSTGSRTQPFTRKHAGNGTVTRVATRSS